MRNDKAWRPSTWLELVAGAEAYRDGVGRDGPYFACYALLRGDASMLARAGHATELVLFLNQWACRLDRTKAPPAFRDWIAAHAPQLERLDGVVLTDPAVPSLAGEIDELYDSLIALQAVLRNLGDAAASKALHQLLPDLVVMWDKAIRQAAVEHGYETYSAFLTAMHELGTRMLAETGMDLAAAETALQGRLGNPQRKTLAKHLDEANWYWLAGRVSA